MDPIENGCGAALSVRIALGFGDFRLDVAHDFPLDGITAVYGPSGCGKTSLLRSIAGLERKARGRVALGDVVWQDEAGTFVAAHRRRVGMVFQDARLFAHLRVRGNLRYADRRAGPDHEAIDWRGVIDALDLEPLLERRPLSLSGGERQRVAIGRTLLARPRLLLMDEPLASLDTGRKAEILPYVARLPRTFGIPVLYVTHSIDEVAQLADRVLVLAAGRKVVDGRVREVLGGLDLDAATGRFEASTVLEAVVTGVDDHYRLTRLDLAGQALVMPAGDYRTGETVRLRLRARDVALATARPEQVSIRNVLAGRVAEIQSERDSPFAETWVDVGGATIRARITRESVDALALAPGKPVFALIKSIAVDRGVRVDTPDGRPATDDKEPPTWT